MLDQLGNGLMLGVIIAVSAVGLSLLYGVTKIVNFAHGELIALGAISTLFFSSPETSRLLYLDRFSPLGLDFGISIFFAILLCGFIGGVLELLLFRPLRRAEVSPYGKKDTTQKTQQNKNMKVKVNEEEAPSMKAVINDENIMWLTRGDATNPAHS